MPKISVKELISDCFSRDELALLDNLRIEKSFNVSKVFDIQKYLLTCKAETINVKKSGPHRLNDWEDGWSGSGVYYSSDDYNNLPYYFKNNTYVRLNSNVYEDLDGFLEVELLRCLQEIVLKKFLKTKKDFKGIFEYGCGTGSNIQFLKKVIPEHEYFGSDWAKSACDMLIKNSILKSSQVFCVNYFDPSTYKGSTDSYIAFTNASLEQTGDKYIEFMNFLFSNPQCVGGIHIEPIRELLNLDSDLNKQSYEYAEKRQYLTNFFHFIKQSNVKILEAKDYGIGSKYISGYQVITWIK
ncbi:hypothetical protein [Candidatus Methylopumilus universalis]|jgi:hypothetical protein|uniref:hypothetical protein n=1 Tax=Candidatus Methylopumilus universalis TaxID=2588536 RepID=UPI003BEEE691